MRRITAALPWLVFGAAVVVLLGPSLAGATVPLPNDLLLHRLPWAAAAGHAPPANVELRDVVDTYYPIQRTIWTELRAGRSARWLHDLSLGLPGASFVGWGAFSVFNLTAALLPFELAWSWSMGLRLLAAMGGAHVLVRGLGASRVAGTIAGLAYGLSGFMVGWLGWPQSHVAAVVPWLLWAAARTAGRDPPWWSGPVLALVTAALWLGGFPAVSLYALLAAGVVALHGAWAPRDAGPVDVARRLVVPAAAVVLGTALVAVLLLPSMHLLGQLGLSHRDVAWQARLPVRALATFLVPDAYGHPLTPPLWLGVSYVEGVAYAGVTTLTLASCAWLLAPRRRGVGLFTALGAGAAAIAYGVPGIQHLVGATPLLRTNPPPRVVVLAALSVAVLGGLGYDAFRSWRAGHAAVSVPALTALGAAVGVAVAAALALLLSPTARQGLVETLPPEVTQAALEHTLRETAVAGVLVAALLAVLGLGALALRRRPTEGAAVLAVLVVALVGADMLRFGATWNPQTPRAEVFPQAPGIEELRQASRTHRVAATGSIGQPNTHLLYGFRDVRAHTFVTRRQREVYVRLGVEWLSPTSWTLREGNSARWDPWLGLLGVREVMTRDDEAAGSFRVRSTDDRPLGPLVRGDLLVTAASAPLDGTLEALRFMVGTYQRTNEGHLEVTVHTARGEVRSGRVPVDGLADLRLATVPIEPLRVRSGEELGIHVSATASSPDRAVTLLGGPAGGTPGDEPTLALLYAAEPLVARPVRGAPRLQLVETAGAPPLVHAVAEARAVPQGGALAALEAAELGDVVLVERAEGDAHGLPPGGSATVERWTRSGGTITARVDSSDGAVVVALDQALPGWRASVGGEPAPLLTANHLFLGVMVPPGAHEVVFTYRAPGVRAGAGVSLAGLLLLAGWSLVAFRRRGT